LSILFLARRGPHCRRTPAQNDESELIWQNLIHGGAGGIAAAGRDTPTTSSSLPTVADLLTMKESVFALSRFYFSHQ
jgi:hypothetical protein